MMVKKMSWCKLRVLRQKVSKLQVLRRKFSTSSSNVEPSRSEPRISPINIQLLSEPLYKQIFTRSQTSTSLSSETASNQSSEVNNGTTNISGNSRADVKINANVKEIRPEKLKEIKKHLQSHKLWEKQTVVEKDVSFQLPPLLGNDIEEHFMNLGRKQTEDYFELAERLQNSEIPSQPTQWEYAVGWTKYHADGTTTAVDYPDVDVLVFDVELVVTEGNYPTMATAVSDKHWFSWCSEYLVLDKFHWSQGIQMDELIPLEPTPGSNDIGSRPKLVIGHNVGFDRTYVKEQYYIKKSKLRFMDTMSMHIAVCGLTNFQRVLYKASKSNSNLKAVADFRKKQKLRGVAPSEDWLEVSTMNNLADVHQLHVGGDRLNKDKRNIFVEGNMVDVRHYFQDLMCYCATDVKSTCEVFKVLWREFNDRFPHPVTLAGMMEMGTGYLPINQNWDRYIHQSNTVFADMQTESKQILMKIANDACQYSKDDRYKEDPWLWNLDWAVKPIRIKKQVVKKPRKKKGVEEEIPVEVEKTDEELVSEVLQVQDRHYKTTGELIGYPTWYRDLCPRMTKEDWTPGPSNISYQTRVTPKLLRLTWDSYPLHYDDTHGWGYLVPGNIHSLQEQDMILQEQIMILQEQEMMEEESDVEKDEKSNINAKFPYSQLCKIMNINPDGSRLDQTPDHGLDTIIDGEIITEGGMTDEEFEQLQYMRMNSDGFNNDSWKHLDKVGESENRRRHISIKPGKKQGCKHTGDGPYHDVNIPGCWFFKIPHKDGKGLRVGNPLAKDYANRAEDGTLRPQSDNGADNVLQLNKACSYWKMNQKRIESQMIVSLKEDEIPDTVKMAEGYSEGDYIGAIVPRIVPAGTITRRAVEPTWLTASNAYTDRVGSELKSMIQAPPGYNFVGADVDSQELWIGAILGDAHFGKSHGCTALGWMTLQGNKKDKTDLHSVVADTVDISRDHAKIFNYGRIYGAGQKFAQKLLLQFNHRLSEKQAKEKATLLFTTTKGKKSNGKWEGGSESSMFNQLEDIARRDCPQTPVLGCRISKALEPENVNDEFMTSRINWVVQSSAVDYLHLMLVSMRWLFDEFNIDGRFCISIHDEVRYLVSSEDRYRAALALQITNLLTRSMFAHKLGIQDLPQSVAFFSAVDIDKCLRKEVTMDCVTPSNPHGMVRGYQIQQGEALDIHQILEITQGSLEKAKPHKHQMVEEEIQPDIAVQI